MPQQPMLIMYADRDFTADEMADIERRFAAAIASRQVPIVMIEPRELMDPFA